MMLEKDERKKTPVTLLVQSVGPVLLDVTLAQDAAPDQRQHVPIQVDRQLDRQID